MSALSPRLHSLSDVEIAIEQAVHGDEHCHEFFLCTLMHCAGGNGRGFIESGSLQPA